MEDNLSSKHGESINQVIHVETLNEASKPEISEEDGYQMTKVTYLAMIALYWSWATVSCTSISTTTVSHQVADVGGFQVLAWISNASLVVQVALQAICGSYGDHFGKRWPILIGSLIGIAGGITAGRAHTIGQIIAGQVLFGISSALNLLGIPASQEIIPSRYRPLAAAGNQIVIIVLSCTMQLATGATVKNDIGGVGQGWRWSYYLPAIINGVNFLLNFFFYRPPPTRIQRKSSTGALLKSLDLSGYFLAIAGLVLLTMALVWGGNMYSWTSTHTLASLIIGVAIIIVFAVYEWKGTNRGLLDHRLFENRNFAILLAVAFVDGLLLFGMLVFVPQEVAVFTNDAVVQVLPVVGYTITTGLGGLSAGAFMFLTKRYRVTLLFALLWMTLFIGLLALVKNNKEWMIYAWPTLAGWGVGVTTTLPTTLTSLSVPDDLIGTAVTLSGTARSVGGIIGVTIFSSVYNNKFNAYAPGHISDAALKSGLSPKDLGSVLMAVFSRNTSTLLGISNMSPPALTAISLASAESALYGYKYVYITIFPFCLLCAGMVMFLKSVDEHMTGHVESKLEAKGVDKISNSMMEV